MPLSPMVLADLQHCSLDTLERVYAHKNPFDVPEGRFRGVYLAPVDSRGARRPLNRLAVLGGFRLPRYGVDFDRRAWWFHLHRLQVGAFVPRRGPSRWRDTETVGLHYDPSFLPGPVKKLLYDEVKPLSAHLCLGMGGMNRPAGEGELFFFALTR